MTRKEIIDTIKLCIGEPSCDGCSFEHSATECRDTLLKAALDFLLEEQPPQGSQDAAEMPEPWSREKVLADAKKNVCGQREHDYGSPEDSFKTIANLWTAYMTGTCGEFVEFSPVDVSVMLGLLKVARIASNPKHMDNWVDLAGYAACGGEIAGKEAQG